MLNEKLSAWVDGELDDAEAEPLMRSVLRQPDLWQACETAFLVGDVLRGEPQLSPGFSAGVMAALEAEPVILAPGASLARRREPVVSRALPRWMALAASAAGVAFVGWLALSPSGPVSQVDNATLAKAVTPPALQLTHSPRNDDEAYMMAHYASATGGPVPGVSAFVRTVSGEQMGSTR